MAISLEFLSKTKMGAMKDVMGVKSGAAQQNKSANSLFAQKTENKQQKADIANMNSSDLMKYVYNNMGNINNNDIKLPAHLKYDNHDFAINGKSFDEAVKMIADKTGDSKSKVEQKLKKDFGTQTSGGSMNFQA